ncbi:MAG: hypothetical protein WAQ28_14545 [Bacteroidia bacterium]|jgi:hypothetical protein
MKAYILNSCMAACKNKAGMEEATNNNREEISVEQSAERETRSTKKQHSFDRLGTTEKRMHEMVDFSGGLLGI